MTKGSHSIKAHLRLHMFRLVGAVVFDQDSSCHDEYLFGVCWERGEREF
jgi:hypothetical protein